MANPLVNCIQFLGFAISITTFVLIIMIYEATKENPLESIIVSSNSFIVQSDPLVKSNSHLDTLGSYCQCGEKITENICTEEQIISGCFDVSKNSNKLQLRHLGDINCDEYTKEITTKLNYSKVFDLGFDMVNKMALGLVIISAAFLGSLVLLLLVIMATICECEAIIVLCSPCICVAGCAIIFGGIANLVLFIILMVNYYKGKTTGEFLDYYNNCEFVKTSKIIDAYDKLDRLDSLMTAYVTLNFIGMFINCFSSSTAFKKEEK